jgi:cyclopropane-fatty-acyl-phospholipid synthase
MFLEKKIEHVIERLRGSGSVPLRVELWDGRRFDLAPAPAVTLRVAGPQAMRYFLSPSLNGLGEAFIEGHVDVEGSIHEIFRVGVELSRQGVDIGRRALPRLTRHSRAFDRKAIEHHYDVSNEFYSIFLDRNMLYSCAYFRSAADSLDTAQEQKLDHILAKLRLKRGEQFLDIGCGWGALVIRAARKYGALAKGITLSTNQFEYAQQRIREEGLADQCSVELRDYRDMQGSGEFDKIAGIGVSEHVGFKNLPVYFGKVSELLRPGGLFLNHGITSTDIEERWVGGGGGEFIDRYVFPNGELPHLSRAVREISGAGLEVTDVESLRRHYAATCRLWADRLDAGRERAIELAGQRRFRIWQLYLAGCAHGFARGWIDIHQILARKTMNGDSSELPWTRDYMYLPNQAAYLNTRGDSS